MTERASGLTTPIRLGTFPRLKTSVSPWDLPDLVSLAQITGSPRPRAIYDELRSRWGPVAPVEIAPGAPGWIVLAYAEATQVLRHDRLFSADGGRWVGHERIATHTGSHLDVYIPRGGRVSVNHQDGRTHARLRKPFDDAVAHLDEAAVAKQVRMLCDGLLDRVATRGQADLVAEYTAPLPMMVTTSLLGLAPEVGSTMMHLVGRIVGGDDPRSAGQELQTLLGEQIGVRLQSPSDDVASLMVHHPSFGNFAEVGDALMVFAGAAGEHLLAWISQALLLLMGGGPLATRVQHGVLSIDDALDLVLWRESPAAHVIPRIASQDTELGRQCIRAGEAVVVAIHAVNSDPALSGDDLWDQVGNRAHLSFGAGPHACPAQRIARIVAGVAVQTVLTRLRPRLVLSPDGVEWTSSISNRRPARLPVVFDPERLEPIPDWNDADAPSGKGGFGAR